MRIAYLVQIDNHGKMASRSLSLGSSFTSGAGRNGNKIISYGAKTTPDHDYYTRSDTGITEMISATFEGLKTQAYADSLIGRTIVLTGSLGAVWRRRLTSSDISLNKYVTVKWSTNTLSVGTTEFNAIAGHGGASWRLASIEML